MSRSERLARIRRLPTPLCSLRHHRVDWVATTRPSCSHLGHPGDRRRTSDAARGELLGSLRRPDPSGILKTVLRETQASQGQPVQPRPSRQTDAGGNQASRPGRCGGDARGLHGGTRPEPPPASGPWGLPAALGTMLGRCDSNFVNVAIDLHAHVARPPACGRRLPVLVLS